MEQGEGRSQVAVAESIARRAHEGQVDKAGRPYIDHPAWVAAHVDGAGERAVAWLHDVLEDTDLTCGDLMAEGVGEDVVEAVVALTRRRGEPYDLYIGRLSSNTLARAVKIADLRHNLDLGRLACVTPSDIERAARYARALRLLGDEDELGEPRPIPPSLLT